MAIITAFPGGEAPVSLPVFTYTGTFSLIDDGDDNWRIKFLTSGTLTITNGSFLIDLFLVGGGGNSYACGGAGGGYTNTQRSLSAQKNVAYPLVVGAAGGGQSSGFSYTAAGGANAGGDNGTNGGSGGGGRSGGQGGYNGSNGTAGSGDEWGYGGNGQGTNTQEFAEAAGAVYSSGGPGSGAGYPAGLTGANSGRGGGGDAYTNYGFSGIVIIRNHRAA